MPRKKKVKADSPTAIADPHADLPPEEHEIIHPAPNRPRKSSLDQFKDEITTATTTGQTWEKPGYVARTRPDGPRKRNLGDERVISKGETVDLSRVTTNLDDQYFVKVTRPLSDEKVDGERMFLSQAKANRLIAAGFDDISDRQNRSEWSGEARKVHDIGTDLNVLAVVLDEKGERMGRGR